MAKLTINNIGPLKSIAIDLNKINVFIGPQSVGKSTIAKLISFCNWLEKDCVLHQSVDHISKDFITDNLITYHNFKGYFTEKSALRYEGQAIDIELTEDKISISKTGNFTTVGLSKNAYIPSERNMLSIPGILSIKMPNNYLLEFIDDWQEIRSKYTGDDELGILNLGSSYFFNEKDGADMIHLSDGQDIRFSQASSGLQSVTPLCVCIDYLTSWIYLHEENRSAEDRKRYRDVLKETYAKILLGQIGDDGMMEALKVIAKFKSSEDLLSDLTSIANSIETGEKSFTDIPQNYQYLIYTLAQANSLNYKLTHPASTNLVIEEPEQNLFPETQVNLVYYILSKLDHDGGRDSLVLTTHSPYILYALNNCLLAYIASKENEEAVAEMSSVPKEAWVNPSIVSVWELRDGIISGEKTIQDEKGLVRGNYFDRVMRNVMADFTNLLNVIE